MKNISPKKKKIPLIVKIILAVLAIFLLALIGYLAYLLFSYKRIEDRKELSIDQPQIESELETVKIGKQYTIVTYNLGFGAYTPEFSFFMDGGKYSVAQSKESVIETIDGATSYVKDLAADFILFQEVDFDATRSYHVNQYEMLKKAFPQYVSNYAVNYDSAYLFYPFYEPHGKNKSGLATFSRYEMTNALRRSLPISTSLSKFFDLDRCYSVTRLPVENGKELCLYNVHLSAYGNSDEIRAEQINMLCDDMQAEYEQGNYIICGGDFNHDLKNLVMDTENEYSWAYPFPREMISDNFLLGLDCYTKEEKDVMPNSSRNADMEYVEGITYTVTLDGYIISDNVKLLEYEHLSTGFMYSDHEPVRMRFILN